MRVVTSRYIIYPSLVLLCIFVFKGPLECQQTLTKDEVIFLMETGVSEQEIIEQIKTSGSKFQLTDQDVKELKERGASPSLLEAMGYVENKPATFDFEVLSPDEVLQAIQTNVSEQEIISMIQRASKVARWTVDDWLKLRSAGVPNNIIRAIQAKVKSQDQTPKNLVTPNPVVQDYGAEVEYFNTVNAYLSDKDAQKLIDAHSRLLSRPNLPTHIIIGVYGDFAYIYFMKNDIQQGLDAFEKTVQYGYNDIIAIHSNKIYGPLFQNPRFQKIYSKMRISRADWLELQWLYSEMRCVNHDTNMMITENMGRIDSDFTEVLQSQIPSRQPQSPTILLLRGTLRMFQNLQKRMVMESDRSRIMHNTNMGIIRNYPSGNGSRPNEDLYTKQTKIRESQLNASRRAQARRQAVAQRQFVLPPGISTALEPCPALGSIPSIDEN